MDPVRIKAGLHHLFQILRGRSVTGFQVASAEIHHQSQIFFLIRPVALSRITVRIPAVNVRIIRIQPEVIVSPVIVIRKKAESCFFQNSFRKNLSGLRDLPASQHADGFIIREKQPDILHRMSIVLILISDPGKFPVFDPYLVSLLRHRKTLVGPCKLFHKQGQKLLLSLTEAQILTEDQIRDLFILHRIDIYISVL